MINILYNNKQNCVSCSDNKIFLSPILVSYSSRQTTSDGSYAWVSVSRGKPDANTHNYKMYHSVKNKASNISAVPVNTERRFGAEFRLFSAHFQPIFRLKWYPILVIYISAVLMWNLGRKTQAWYPICCFSATFLRIPPIFRLCSAHFPPSLLLILCWSCLAGSIDAEAFYAVLSHTDIYSCVVAQYSFLWILSTNPTLNFACVDSLSF